MEKLKFKFRSNDLRLFIVAFDVFAVGDNSPVSAVALGDNSDSGLRIY